MKLAVLADIHAGYVALQTVAEHIDRWQPDCVVVAGDIVNRGPRPLECLNFVKQRRETHGWKLLKGNHEDYVLDHAKAGAAREGIPFQLFRSSYWTYQQLLTEISVIDALPTLLEMADGVRITHASMRGLRDGVYANAPEETLREQVGTPAPKLFCVGHTHQAFVRRMGDTTIVNVGAVGLPFDGDWRPAYAQIHFRQGNWHAEIIRLPYDRAAAEQDFFETSFMDESGPLSKIILKELRVSRGQLFSWNKLYEPAVSSGQLSMEQAVQRFLDNGEGEN